MSINTLIINAVKPIVPIGFHNYTGIESTYATFFTYNQRGGVIADDDEVTTVYSVQVDVYSKGNIENIVKESKALKPYGFRRVSEMELFEETTKTYRKMITFSVSLEAEE